jgi:alpha-L-rhamnosidase
LETQRGRVAIRWDQTPEGLRVETTLPDGVSGVLALPDGTERHVAAGTITTTVAG